MRPTLASPVLETYPSQGIQQLSYSCMHHQDPHHYHMPPKKHVVGASKPCCPPPPPPLPLVPSDTMVARNLASFASQHAKRRSQIAGCVSRQKFSREDWDFEYVKLWPPALELDFHKSTHCPTSNLLGEGWWICLKHHAFSNPRCALVALFFCVRAISASHTSSTITESWWNSGLMKQRSSTDQLRKRDPLQAGSLTLNTPWHPKSQRLTIVHLRPWHPNS